MNQEFIDAIEIAIEDGRGKELQPMLQSVVKSYKNRPDLLRKSLVSACEVAAKGYIAEEMSEVLSMVYEALLRAAK
jgi:hypothetical protein